MSPLFMRQRRAEAFDDVLAGHVAPRGAELSRLVAVVDAVRTVPPVDPDPAFVSSLRDRLMTAAESEMVEQKVLPRQRHETHRTPPPTKSPRRIAAVATSLILAGGAVGMANASSQALPGDLLYPVKRGGEHLNLAIHSGPGADGAIRLEQASTRLQEVQGLLATRSDEVTTDEYVSDGLRDFTVAAREGTGLMLDAYETEDDSAALTRLNTFLERSSRTLDELSGDVPVSAAQQLAAAARLLATLDQAAGTVCATCGFGGVDDSVNGILDTVDGILQANEDLPPGSVTKVDEPAEEPGHQPNQQPADEPGDQGPRGNPDDDPSVPIQEEPTNVPTTPDDDDLLPTEVTLDLPGDDDSGDTGEEADPTLELPELPDLPSLPDLELD